MTVLEKKEYAPAEDSLITLRENYSMRVVDNYEDFKKLKNIWDALASHQKEYFPFLCFDWFDVWLKHFLKDNKLMIILLYKGEEVVAIGPLISKVEKYKGLSVRKVELIGNVYSPIRYFIFANLDNEERKKSISVIFDFLSDSYVNWDVIDFKDIPEENENFNCVQQSLAKGNVCYTEYFCYGDWYIDEINYSGDEYLKQRPGNISKNVPYRMRRLRRIGKLEFKLIASDDHIDQIMDVYYDLYSRSWQKQEGVGPTFHRDLAKMASRNGWLRLGFLYFNDIPMSCQFWISANRYVYILKLFYDEKYQDFAPGKILTAELMKYVIDADKAESIDYVQGDETYKKDWTPKRRERKGVMVYNKNLKGQCIRCLNDSILPIMNKSPYLHKAKEIIKKFF